MVKEDRCESVALETRQLLGEAAGFTLQFVAPAQWSVVGSFLQGEGAHHRLAEELGPADLLLPVLLQGQRWLLRLLRPQFEPWTADINELSG